MDYFSSVKIMQTIRIIPKLEVKGDNLIKGIHLEGLRIVGRPEEAALEYYKDGADELIFIDLVASLYQRKSFLDLIERTAKKIFIPLTVGGGIRSINDVKMVLRAGADKVAVNTAALERPELVSEIADKFGSQCMVLSMEVQEKSGGGYECYTDCGRTRTGVDPFSWASKAVNLGAGEILLTSINRDGTMSGFDISLVRKISDDISVPIIASGGAGNPEHIEQAILQGHADAVSLASILHFNEFSLPEIKRFLKFNKISIREIN